MNIVSPEWEQRNSALWNAIDIYEAEVFVGHVENLVAELPSSHPVGKFELACAQDSTGHADLAVPLYHLPRYNRSLARYAAELDPDASQSAH